MRKSNAFVLAGSAVMLLLLPATVTARGQCRAPMMLPKVVGDYPDARQPRRITPVTNYLFTLSWSPQHCRNDRSRGSSQCDGSGGNFGFVVHGLWPETDGPNWPQYCAPVRLLTPREVAENYCMTPDAQLLQHEWAKHGSCMSSTPNEYFAKSRALHAKVRFPAMLRLSRDRNLKTGDFRLAFARANPWLRRDMFQIVKTRDNWLDEVRICLDRMMQPQRCPAGIEQPGDRSILKIWRGSLMR